MSFSAPVFTFLIACPDQPGIVAAISRFIFEQHGNILESDQYSTNQQNAPFFMRVSFVQHDHFLTSSELSAAFAAVAARFEMTWSLHSSQQRKRAAILVSTLDHCLIDLLWRWQSRELALDIPCIISNHVALEPLARMYGIPFYHFPVHRESRAADQRRLLEFLAGSVDFLILARYMQILEPFLVEAYVNRVINIHHGFLPAFVGAKPYHQAFERGVKLVGATAHYVTTQLDEGPIIAQDVIRCNHRDTVEDLVRKGRDVERRVLAEAVRLHLADRVLVYGNKTVVFE